VPSTEGLTATCAALYKYQGSVTIDNVVHDAILSMASLQYISTVLQSVSMVDYLSKICLAH